MGYMGKILGKPGLCCPQEKIIGKLGMKVICKENTARNLDLKEVSDISYKEYKFPLEVGSEYIVMGIAMYKGTNYLYYLVDTGLRSFWMPYELFEISDKAFPPNWHINVFDKKKYPETSTL